MRCSGASFCGSALARSLGIDSTPESVRKFAEAYMAMHPYLSRYVTAENLTGKRTLEIGLGYVRLGQLVTLRGCQNYSLDIADGPVEIMRYRLALLGKEAGARGRQLAQLRTRYVREILTGRGRRGSLEEAVRARYDSNAAGDAAPHSDFVSRSDVQRYLFRRFSSVRIDIQNFHGHVLFRGRIVIPREKLLDNVARILGTDLYIAATK